MIDAPLIAALIWLSQVDMILVSTSGSDPPFDPFEPFEEPVPVPDPDFGDGLEPYAGDEDGWLVGFDPYDGELDDVGEGLAERSS